MLAIRPDGSLLQAKLSDLSGTPFVDWRTPGILLAALVGGGFLLTAEWQRRGLPGARELSIFAGLGLVAFEVTEVIWLGFQPLQAIFGLVGIVVVILAAHESSTVARGDT